MKAKPVHISAKPRNTETKSGLTLKRDVVTAATLHFLSPEQTILRMTFIPIEIIGPEWRLNLGAIFLSETGHLERPIRHRRRRRLRDLL